MDKNDKLVPGQSYWRKLLNKEGNKLQGYQLLIKLNISWSWEISLVLQLLDFYVWSFYVVFDIERMSEAGKNKFLDEP